MACNAPIAPLHRLGVEIKENSELNLLQVYRHHEGDARIPALVKKMQREVSMSQATSGILPRLAQYELTLRDWAEEHRDSRKYVAFANKCWPALQPEFGFTPCYVNGRLTADSVPVSCEVDVYGGSVGAHRPLPVG